MDGGEGRWYKYKTPPIHYPMKHILLVCKTCSKEFNYPQNEYNRQTKKGRDFFFCSLSCARIYLNTNLPETTRRKLSKSTSKQMKGNRHSAKGDFTYHLNKAKARSEVKNQLTDLTEEYLKSIWTGRCALSNISLTLKKMNEKNTLYTCSLDRIDSSKGYIQGNVQFVAYPLNLAKASFTNDEMLEFIKILRNGDAGIR
jgi:Glu-tRNA(Gln) amidotransferase subunit E-like FAD-binding protein